MMGFCSSDFSRRYDILISYSAPCKAASTLEFNMKGYALIAVALACLALTSCGASGPSAEIDLTMTDFQFSPNSFAIPAGQEITLNVANTGAVEHEFVIFKLGTDAGDEFDEGDQQNIYWKVEALPGQSATMTFTAPTEPGAYSVVCGIPGHIMAGMVGTLTVVAGE